MNEADDKLNKLLQSGVLTLTGQVYFVFYLYYFVFLLYMFI